MRDDLIKFTNPSYGKYKALRDEGHSHQSALQAMRCEEAMQYQIAAFKREAELFARMTIE